MTKKHSSYKKVGLEGSTATVATNAEAERRPGGMVVQMRDDADDGANHVSQDPMKIRVSYGPSLINLNVTSNSTFGDVKRLLSQETSLDPSEQRLYYRGIEKDDNVHLTDAGVKNSSKLLLREVEAIKEKKLEQMKKKKEEIARACEAISQVSEEVRKLSEKVAALEESVLTGNKVPEKEFLLLEELLMRQLLKLDGILAEEAAKEQRKQEVRRIQSLEKKLEELKERNANPFRINRKLEPSVSTNNSNTVAVTTQWETFDSGVGSLNPPSAPSSANPSNDWEHFD